MTQSQTPKPLTVAPWSCGVELPPCLYHNSAGCCTHMHNSMTSQNIVTKVNSLPNYETLQSTLISLVVIKFELFNFNAHTTSLFGFACFYQ